MTKFILQKFKPNVKDTKKEKLFIKNPAWLHTNL
jgi:hypothetical protein